MVVPALIKPLEHFNHGFIEQAVNSYFLMQVWRWFSLLICPGNWLCNAGRPDFVSVAIKYADQLGNYFLRVHLAALFTVRVGKEMFSYSFVAQVINCEFLV